MSFTFEWDDVKFMKGVLAKNEEALDSVLSDIAAEASETTSVESGLLQASVGYRVERRGFYCRGLVGYGLGGDSPVNRSGMTYAVFYERGTYKMSGRFTMTRAWDANIMRFKGEAGWVS